MLDLMSNILYTEAGWGHQVCETCGCGSAPKPHVSQTWRELGLDWADMRGQQSPARGGVAPGAGVPDVGGERLALELAGEPSPEPGDAGVPDHDRGQFLFGHLGQPLAPGALQGEIVLFGVEPAVGPGEDQPVVDELVEGVRVGGELGGLQPAF